MQGSYFNATFQTLVFSEECWETVIQQGVVFYPGVYFYHLLIVRLKRAFSQTLLLLLLQIANVIKLFFINVGAFGYQQKLEKQRVMIPQLFVVLWKRALKFMTNLLSNDLSRQIGRVQIETFKVALTDISVEAKKNRSWRTEANKFYLLHLWERL